MKCYIDTNILIEYLYRNHISETARKDTVCCKLIDKGAEGEYEIFISDYTIIEISQHFTDYFLMLKSIEDGYSYREFSRIRKDYSLNQDEIETITQMIDILVNNKYLNYIDIERNTGNFYKIIIPYVKNYLDFMDAAHLRTAIDVGCDYFITKDAELRKRAQELINQGVIEKSIQLYTPQGFLKQLNRQTSHSKS